MSEQTPSQAEGERDDEARSYDPPRTTPSQAEGERVDEPEEAEAGESGGERPLADASERYARARGDEEPGAHSGGESEARERIVPGTASAAEGYRTLGGTLHGEPLAGVGRTAGGEGAGLISRDHVRELLATRDDRPTLVILEGRARVVSADDLGSARYAGAVEVMSGEELTRQVGQGSPSERDLDDLAARLESMVSKLGA
jgi:hypothetical protein